MWETEKSILSYLYIYISCFYMNQIWPSYCSVILKSCIRQVKAKGLRLHQATSIHITESLPMFQSSFIEVHTCNINTVRIKQGKSEGFESCDRPIVRKRPIWVKIGDVLYRVTLKFDGWPWKTIGHLSFDVSSFVQHFIAIGEFKLELQSGNAPICVKFDDF